MPKAGRRGELSYMSSVLSDKMAFRNAPFGTDSTPSIRMKIIGGRPIYSYETLKKEQNGIDIEQYHQNDKSPRIGTPNKLTPLTAKPNQIDPAVLIRMVNEQQYPPPSRFQTADQDKNQSHQHNTTRDPVGHLNPYRKLPPIDDMRSRSANGVARGELPVDDSTTNEPRDRYDEALEHRSKQHHASQEIKFQYPFAGNYSNARQKKLIDLIDPNVYLPHNPLRLTPDQELELRRRIAYNLKGFDINKLKDIYLQLTAYDAQVTGFVDFRYIEETFSKYKVNLTLDNMRLSAAQFVSPIERGKVYYEKLLTFLFASGKDSSLLTDNSPREEADEQKEVYYNPITHDENSDDIQGNQETAKLYRLIEQQLEDTQLEIDFGQLWLKFQQADRERRGTLSPNQVKELCYACRIPLQEQLIIQVMNKCDQSNGQVNWQQFLEFLERVQPLQTGLTIPFSKRPLEYAKHFPNPTSNWPKGLDNPLLSPKRSPEPRTDRTHSVMSQRPILSPIRQQSPSKLTTRETSPNKHIVSFNPITGIFKDQEEQKSRGNEMNILTPRHTPPQDELDEIQQKLEKQRLINNLDTELKQLEGEYQKTKKALLDNHTHLQNEPDRKSTQETWNDRFLNLGRALYSNDPNHSGFLELDRARFLCHGYNGAYKLDLSDSTITDALIKCNVKDTDLIAIDQLLRLLSTKGP